MFGVHQALDSSWNDLHCVNKVSVQKEILILPTSLGRSGCRYLADELSSLLGTLQLRRSQSQPSRALHAHQV